MIFTAKEYITNPTINPTAMMTPIISSGNFNSFIRTVRKDTDRNEAVPINNIVARKNKTSKQNMVFKRSPPMEPCSFELGVKVSLPLFIRKGLVTSRHVIRTTYRKCCTEYLEIFRETGTNGTNSN